jgi:hypothetical protein
MNRLVALITEFLSIATIELENKSDTFLSRLKGEAEKMRILGKLDYARATQPRGQIISRDMIALGQGFQTPPHLAILAEVTALEAAPNRRRFVRLPLSVRGIHEAGLFQGKLGFTKAILILEEGREEFSNIHGLGQIRFLKGNIKAVFESIRLVVEREGLIE